MDSGGVTREWFSTLSNAISRGSPELFCAAGVWCGLSRSGMQSCLPVAAMCHLLSGPSGFAALPCAYLKPTETCSSLNLSHLFSAGPQRNQLYINPLSSTPTHLKKFQFVGLFMAKAILESSARGKVGRQAVVTSLRTTRGCGVGGSCST
jgi:hypothetical protein